MPTVDGSMEGLCAPCTQHFHLSIVIHMFEIVFNLLMLVWRQQRLSLTMKHPRGLCPLIWHWDMDFTAVQWMAFHMMCQRRILDVYWFGFIPNTSYHWTHSPGESPQLDLHSQEAPGDLWTCLPTFWNLLSSQFPESGCRCMLRPHTWRSNTMETSSWTGVSHLDATAGSWHWTHHWQFVEHCQ